MSLTSLTSYTQSEYNGLNNAFSSSPTQNPLDNPDGRVNIHLDGWSGGSGQVMAFTVTANAGVSAFVFIDTSNDNTIKIEVMETGINESVRTYWTVDMGRENSRSLPWIIVFETHVNSRPTGKWVFRKGSSDPNF